MTARVIVTGARDWDEELHLHHVLDEIHAEHPDMLLVHGACTRGADRFADRWALLRGVPVERHPADWRAHGRAAGPMRNRQMVEAGAVLCVAFLTAASRGARGCVGMAEEAGIRSRRIHPERSSGGAR